MALANMGLNPESTEEALTSSNDIIEWKSTEDEDHHKFSRSIMQPCNISQSNYLFCIWILFVPYLLFICGVFVSVYQ